MPGYGIGDAATTLVGQSYGAGRRDLTRRFAYITVFSGMIVMGLMGILMYAGAPWIMASMTPDAEVVDLGVMALRIEAFAEPLYAVSIASAGAMRGAGESVVPMLVAIIGMIFLRIPAVYLLADWLGPEYMFYGFGIGWSVGVVLGVSYFLSGRWKRRGSLAE